MDRPNSLIDARDILAAVGLLTRLPVPVDGNWAVARGARSAWAYPLAGLVVGCLMAGVAQAALAVGLTDGLAAGLALLSAVIVTGALHEDGLADTADGLWGGWTPARRLEIMKDSRIGTYGVLALVLIGLFSWQAVVELLRVENTWALIAVPAASRGVMPALMRMPQARPGGVSASVGTPSVTVAALAAGLGVLLLLPLGGVTGLIVACAMAGASAALGALAMRKIGGQTGDILGAAQHAAQLAGWLSLIALA